ncbi:uncharacterized protein LOC131328459 [Rhododendron vialii]|uniref:uncharacterized protein LOC131328459 n=1 Tax=Rhododendron vialii TaxID=182163 RepID=UPI00265F406D|nr:uncharacterized protein LOC131328459 [Rhododendron vialii]
MDPLKYLFEKPDLTGKLARWLLMLIEFELKYVTKKLVKARAVAEFLADHPVEGGEDAEFEFPDEDLMTIVEDVWKLYFDGAVNQRGFGIGVFFISPKGSHIPLAFKLNFEVTNNQAEYEANGDWKVKEEKLKLYHQDLEDLIPHFNKVTFTHVPRLKNQFADALATLVAMVEIPIGVRLRPIVIEQRDSLLCFHGVEAKRVMKEIHEGVCGPHMNGMMLRKKILRQGYFWYTIETECIEYVRRCHKCQIHANLMLVSPSELHQMTSPWPFLVWGIDVIGRIVSAASNGHKFILVAIDYFTKWVFVSDNGHFKSRARDVLEEFQIQVHKSTVYRLQTNGAIEAANKIVKMILEKTIQSSTNWHDQLPLALWGYWMSVRTPTGAIPYSLVYGMEAMLPIELEVLSL